jgi:hypothetical protein
MKVHPLDLGVDTPEARTRLDRFKQHGNRINLMNDGPFCICLLLARKPKDNHTRHVEVPFQDHARIYLNRDSGERYFVNQPYIHRGSPEETERQFQAVKNDSETFAAKHGLSVRISKEDSWWNPTNTVLVVYTNETLEECTS